jgi:tripartite-type tricarboxylate transporter receptor subunit TctC
MSLAAACSWGLAWADSYPAKPITLVVAYPAGGDTDALARLFAEKLATRVGQPVVVDNRPGASGIIGSAFVSKAAPDGYTLLLAPSTFSIAQLVLKTQRLAGYDVLNGFTPMMQTALLPLFIAAGGGATAPGT